MWKRGVVTPGVRMQRALERGGTRRFSLTLLAGSQVALRVQDEILIARLYDELVVGGRIHKTTRRNRFKGLDRIIVEKLIAEWPHAEEISIHDVGASSGITTLELWQAVLAQRPARAHASDYYANMLLIRREGTPLTIACDEEGEPLQFTWGEFVFSARQRESFLRPVNRWLQARAMAVLPQVTEVLAARKSGRDVPAGWSIEEVGLWHPVCRLAAAADSRFTMGRHDVCMPLTPRWHFVRAMNVLNPGYFSPERQREAVRALAGSLLPGGLLLMGRTREEADSSSVATLFKSTGDGLVPILDLRGGAENRALVLEAGKHS